MSPEADFFGALVLLNVDPSTGEYLGVIAFGCGVREFIYTGNGMLADVDRATERFPYCVVAGSVSEAVQAAYNDVAADEYARHDEAA